MRKPKKHIHECRIQRRVMSKGTLAGKKVSPLHKGVDRRALSEVYKKFYKDQVTALYRAVID